MDHLPVGFGAHHWAAHDAQRAVLFVTLDRLEPKRRAADLAAAYAGAVALRLAGLEFVLAPLPARSGSLIVRFCGGALSCTPWRRGRSGGGLDFGWTSRALARLHAVPPPAGIPSWKPVIAADFAAEIELSLARPWGPGPYAQQARTAVAGRVDELARWNRRYQELAACARRRPWVATHGEPHSANQLATRRGRYLVDWESLKLAPPERDLRELLDAGAASHADPEMIELFELEWRLGEIDEYVRWFSAEHRGTEDDRIAFSGLLEELNRA